MKYGFIKVASAIPAVKVADCKFNAQQIDTQIAIADGKGVQVIVFPELCITGYSCADLFGQTLSAGSFCSSEGIVTSGTSGKSSSKK